MVRHFVIDTSALMQAYIQDSKTPYALGLMQSLANGGGLVLHIAEFCLVECTNILWKRIRMANISLDKGQKSLGNLLNSPLQVHIAREFMPLALTLAVEPDPAVYDAIVIALADWLACP